MVTGARRRAPGRRVSEARSSWQRAGRGLLVIGIGTFLLLNTTGLLPWAFWLEILAYWPVVLVAIGLRLVFERSRAPALVLLSPLVVLGVMTWVAVAGPGLHLASGRRVVLAAERPEGLDRWRLNGSLGYGELHLDASRDASGRLVSGEAVAVRTGSPLRVSSWEDEARVRFGEREHRRLVVFGIPTARWSRWDMNIAGDLPVDVDLDLALAEGDLDLRDIRVRSLAVEGAFIDADMKLDRPEEDVRIVLEGAFNRFSIQAPRGVPVRISTDGFLNFSDRAISGEGPGYRVSVEGAFNSLNVERPRR